MDEVLRKRGRPSRLDAFRNQIGKMSDEDVARLAGCSVANVYMYRRRHSILNPGETSETLNAGDTASPTENAPPPVARRKPGRPPKNKALTQPIEAAGSAPAGADLSAPVATTSKLRINNPTKTKAVLLTEAPPQSETSGRRARGSVLDHHRDIIGTLSDAEVARIAGCTPANVSVYRRKHGIADAPAPTAPASVPAVVPSPTIEAPPQTSRFAYLVRFLQNGSMVERVLVAGDFPSAMQKAAELEKVGHIIQGARLVGELL